MRTIFGALVAAAVLGGIAASQPADARCFWNGFAMECYRSFGEPEIILGWRYNHIRPYPRDFSGDFGVDNDHN